MISFNAIVRLFQAQLQQILPSFDNWGIVNLSAFSGKDCRIRIYDLIPLALGISRHPINGDAITV